jgi:hypothetical protein
MPYDSEGNFTRVHNWEDDRINGISIDSLRMDEDLDDMANGMSEVMLKNGKTIMTNDLNMNNLKVRNVANGTAQLDAVNYGQLTTVKNDLTSTIDTKANEDLDNLTDAGNSVIDDRINNIISTNPTSFAYESDLKNYFPNYSSGSSFSSGTTTTTNGWLKVRHHEATNATVVIGGVTVYNHTWGSGDYGSQYQVTFIPIPTGKTVTYSGMQSVTWYPCL